MTAPQHRNSFGALRWLFALSVVYCHSFDLMGKSGRGDWVEQVSGIKLSLFGVLGFFVLSGYLNSISLSRARNANSEAAFLVRRAFRIAPLLWLMLTVAVVASFVINGFGRDVVSANLRFFFGNAFLYQPTYSLAGIFADNKNSAICGSLWTLPYEVLCYLILATSGMGTKSGPPWFAKAALAGFVMAMCVLVPQSKGVLLGGIQTFWLGYLGWSFLCGVLLAKTDVFLRGWTWTLASLAFMVGSTFVPNDNFPPLPLLQVLAYGIFVIKIGSYSWGFIARCADRWDASYGIYLLSFPVQQMLLAHHWKHASHWHDPYRIFWVSALISAALGLLTWWLLENPLLNIGKRLSKRIEGSEKIPAPSAPELRPSPMPEPELAEPPPANISC